MRWEWRPYVPVAARKREAQAELSKLKKKGVPISPVVISGQKIAKMFWAKAWCDNLEQYSDFENRLPRGRTYVRNGSVVDLQIDTGLVSARVSGSDIYKVSIRVTPLAKTRWRQLSRACAGEIDSLVEILEGRLKKGVMQRVCDPKKGMFPSPAELEFSCTCPDWASMCKHVAAALYGVGARLDEQPQLLFKLRDVDENDLIAHVTKNAATLPLAKHQVASKKILADDDLSKLFGLDMAKPVTTKKTSPKSSSTRKRL